MPEKQTWTDQDVDSLLASVEETIVKAEALAKANPADPDPNDDQNPPPSENAAPADEAPAPDDGSADMNAGPAADAPPAMDNGGDQALSQENGEDQPLSDEELGQIYSSMPPDELERHYSIIRQALQAAYSQDQGAAPADAGQAPPDQAAQDQNAPPPEMEKSEASAEVQLLKKQVADLAAANEQIVKAFEVLAKPARKSITDLQTLNKSDFADNDKKPLSTQEIKDRAGRLCRNPGSLNKSERDMINRFFIQGEGQQEVEKLIHSKGGN